MSEAAELLYDRLCAALAAAVRLTAPRRAALRCLTAGTQQDWTADELFSACNAAQPGVISRASSYRALELLVQLGLAAADSAASSVEPRRYRLTPPVHDPLLLRDRHSGQELRLPADRWLKRYVERLAQRHGLLLDEFTLELRGRLSPARRHRAAKP